MGKVQMVSAALVFLLGANTCIAADDVGRKMYLLTAKAVDASLVRRNSGFRVNGGYVDAPSTYRFKLADVRVEQGVSQKFPKNLVVEFDVRDDYPFLKAPQVFVVLEEYGATRKVLHLGIVSRTACVPEVIAVQGYEESYFPRDNLRCVSIDDQYQPPDD